MEIDAVDLLTIGRKRADGGHYSKKSLFHHPIVANTMRMVVPKTVLPNDSEFVKSCH